MPLPPFLPRPPAPNGNLCCSFSKAVPPQCSVAIAQSSGVRYMDVPNQRTRHDASSGNDTTIADYTAHKHYFIGHKNGAEFCAGYCPIDKRDTLRMHPFDYFIPAEDHGKTTLDGRPVEHYYWRDTVSPLKVWVDTVNFYADIRDPSAAIPVLKSTNMNPFGHASLGMTNLTWTNFTAGAPDPKLFQVAGLDTCPQMKTCKGPTHRAMRLALGQYYTIAAAEGLI